MPPKLIVFDMDGVLVDTESSWAFVHHSLGVSNRDNLSRYLKGEIDCEEFIRLDIRLWGSIRAEKVAAILSRVPLMAGARETVFELKSRPYRTAIVSAGISLLAERVQGEMGIDRVLSNGLEVDPQGNLTGEGRKVVELRDKLPALELLSRLEGVPLGEMAYIEDSSYDVHVFGRVGKSIAFNPGDSAVSDAAQLVVRENDLSKVLPFLP